ncbi:putative LRR receptor-like serine/threonine-protein kinase [Citrus sinensis]|uniref:LRR receptor-like serine/threonine-protein kinase n=1 Tax=Citrus sinensis TaxID=2711 RepID=A0ACB8JHB5_CITSI|nr:putative LRR receptor-like serine/threonine-protein kinase [Citrus sinensis]
MFSSRGAVLFLFLCLCWSSSKIVVAADDDSITDPIEVSALRSIKKSLVDDYSKLSNWNRGDPCTSNWTGVLCFNTTMDDGYLHLRELLLNGNELTGSLPEELGYLPKLDRIQIDQNYISGPLPKSFANLNKTKHFHMNNNSISGQIPPELSRLPSLVHMLLDNNNLTGYLPPELSELPKLLILQLDNNNFEGTTIPASYSNMSKLLKLSLRNCSLQGPMPDLSRIPNLGYLDLSSNQLNGSIPPGRLSLNITTMFIANNSLSGSIPSSIWQSRTLNATETFILDFQNNNLTNISGSFNIPPNVTVRLRGNPFCLNTNAEQFCGSHSDDDNEIDRSTNSTLDCRAQSCPTDYEYSPTSPIRCFCAAPLLVGYRLKSPGLSYFPAYKNLFEEYMTSGLKLNLYQLDIDSFRWEKGPRLRMDLKFFPVYDNSSGNSYVFNASEVRRIRSMFTGWNIPDSDIFGPYELINFTLQGPYRDVFPPSRNSGISKAALAGIILGAIAGAVTISAIVSLLIVRAHMKNYHAISRRRHSSKTSIKIDGVRSFTYGEMALATNNFNSSTQIGQGGYGKVYKGILPDGTVVAVKRAQEGSLQGEKEFLTEIQFLSRLHHRNLVSLVGYCDEEGEQMKPKQDVFRDGNGHRPQRMLVYEFMSNGTLRDQLSAKSKEPLGFAMRLSIARGSSRGILYLHTEADPPVFHRDIKASNILLDHKFTAKVADFGLSRLAPVPDIEGIVPAHVSTVVKGTPGYLDPEYFLTHKLTDKSDVYSLGVVFLELLTGMQPISHGKNIVREVNIAYQSSMIFSVIDGNMGSYPSECVEKFIKLALKCCQDETDARPSMSEVMRELESIWNMMPESDTKTPEFINSEHTSKEETPPSSSSMLKHPYVSSDVSGSNLVSGVIPTITPR